MPWRLDHTLPPRTSRETDNHPHRLGNHSSSEPKQFRKKQNANSTRESKTPSFSQAAIQAVIIYAALSPVFIHRLLRSLEQPLRRPCARHPLAAAAV